MNRSPNPNEKGFSLVELMIALVLSLIVSGAVLAFTFSSLRTNTEYIKSVRLTQELRTSLNFVGDELRRAGYDEDAIKYAFRPATYLLSSQFAPIAISNVDTSSSCIIYAYDRLSGATSTFKPGQLDPGNGELRGLRRAVRTVNGRSVGVLEFAESTNADQTIACDDASPDYATYPANCNGNWCAFSDARILDITSFNLSDDGVINIPGTANVSGLQIRRIGVDLRGTLINVPGTVRGVHEDIRIRADCVQDNPGTFPAPGNCTSSPSA